MEQYKFEYISAGRSQSGSGFVAFTLERDRGGQFTVILSAADGERLWHDLGDQVQIAKQK